MLQSDCEGGSFAGLQSGNYASAHNTPALLNAAMDAQIE